MPSSLVLNCSKRLADLELCIAFAESASAGRFAAEFSLAPESGRVLTGALVCYDASVKVNVLGIPQLFIEEHTPESPEVTRELAVRLKELIPADIHVGITGLTTPGGSENSDKPVGTIFLHVLGPFDPFSIRRCFSGHPEAIVLQALDEVAASLIQKLE